MIVSDQRSNYNVEMSRWLIQLKMNNTEQKMCTKPTQVKQEIANELCCLLPLNASCRRKGESEDERRERGSTTTQTFPNELFACHASGALPLLLCLEIVPARLF